MTLLYPLTLLLLIPLYLFYKQSLKNIHREKKLQRRLFFLSLFFMIVALSRPVISNTLVEQKFDAQDFIIAVDASYSMQAQDLKPTRYAVVKENIYTLLNSFHKDRFSIFAFTSNAMLISPPTTDTQISFLALQTFNPKYILTKGTSLFNLLKAVAKTSYEKKRLIIFSDGGEEHDLDRLVTFTKKNRIIPYVVATSSQKGSILYENSKKLTDENGNLVISRANPILKDFATQSGGKYYALNSSSSSVVEDLIADLSKEDDDVQSKINILSYTELSTIAIIFALVSFFVAITKIQELFLLVVLFFIPNHADASYVDFYYLDRGYTAFHVHNYKDAAVAFNKVTPSVQSYYNLGVSYYKDKQYKNAIKIFSQIKTTDPKLKQKLFYNMGNCATQLQKYERAKIYYQKALAFGYDKESYENLMLVYNLKEKKDISDMLPPTEIKNQMQASKKTESKKDKEKNQKENKDNSKSSDSKATNEAIKSSNGSASSKGKEKKKTDEKNDTINKAKYKIGYKAYEMINEGFTNEQHPW